MKKSYEEIEAIQSVASLETRLPLYGVLENIRSLYNVGSIFRTADGAGLSRLFLTGFTGFPPQKEIEKTALGATDFLRLMLRLLDAVQHLDLPAVTPQT